MGRRPGLPAVAACPRPCRRAGRFLVYVGVPNETKDFSVSTRVPHLPWAYVHFVLDSAICCGKLRVV
jgi:hypothetical protein